MMQRTVEYTKLAEAGKDLAASALWQQLKDATPAQIRNWMTNNVTTVSDAHEVLTLIVLAVRKLYQ